MPLLMADYDIVPLCFKANLELHISQAQAQIARIACRSTSRKTFDKHLPATGLEERRHLSLILFARSSTRRHAFLNQVRADLFPSAARPSKANQCESDRLGQVNLSQQSRVRDLEKFVEYFRQPRVLLDDGESA